MKKILITLSIFCFLAPSIFATQLTDNILEFADKLSVQNGMQPAHITLLIQQAKFNPKIIELMDKQFERSTWANYKKGMVTEARSKKGGRFYADHKSSLELVYTLYGVVPEIVAAILAVETDYGDFKLQHRAMDALVTLGFYYPRRAEYFRSELASLLTYSHKSGIDPFSIKSSYAGAVGIPQFMPSNINKFGVDFSGDGLVDLVNSRSDAIGSVGNYLSKYGWQKNKPTAIKVRGKNLEKFIGYDLKFTVEEMKKAGVRFSIPVGSDEKSSIIKLEGDKGDEYWAIFGNFKTIMKYNNSANYALSVLLLSKNIEKAKRELGVKDYTRTD